MQPQILCALFASPVWTARNQGSLCTLFSLKGSMRWGKYVGRPLTWRAAAEKEPRELAVLHLKEGVMRVPSRALLIMGASVLVGHAHAAITRTWTEEVRLHDGRTVIAERRREYGGIPFPPHAGPRRELLSEEWRFPFNGGTLAWSNPWRRTEKISGLAPMIFDVVGGVPYLASVPITCISFNRWGRPNPPYVFQRYSHGEWHRIEASQFPQELKDANLLVEVPQNNEKLRHLSAQQIAEKNRRPPVYMRTVLPQRIEFGEGNFGAECPTLSWDGAGWTTPR